MLEHQSDEAANFGEMRRATGMPSTSTGADGSSVRRPFEGRWRSPGNKPLRCNKSVVFPAPLGPTKPTRSRGATVNDTSRNANRPSG